MASLLPNLAAMELVLDRRLDAELSDALKVDHQKMREFAERLAMVSEAMARSRSSKSVARRARAVLCSLSEALGELGVHQQAAFSRLKATLSVNDLGELDDSLEAAIEQARSDIVLIAQPEVPPTQACVFRRYTDLDRPYATNLAELERRSPRGRGPAD